MKKLVVLLICFSYVFQPVFAQEAAIKSLVNQGVKLHDEGEYVDAIVMYKKALVLDKRSALANYEIASSYFAEKNYTNCIKHCNVVIDVNKEFVDQAYILKGSAQDILGKPRDAVSTYKKGLQKYKENYLLYYNLALTSFNLKEYKDAEDALQHSLRLNPSHASSHFLLGLTMLMQEQRVKGILAIYNFLLLEPKSKRTASALQALDEELQKGVKKDGENSVTITIPSNKADDEFSAAELMLGLLESSKSNEANKNKSPQELFVENTHSLFTILGELKKDKKGFWWNFYVDYFYTLADNKHTEAFCHYITQSKGENYTTWVQDNLPKLEAFSEWYLKYLHKIKP